MNQNQQNQNCACMQAAPQPCTLGAPQPVAHACHPAPFHRHECQSDAYFTMQNAYGM